MSRDNHVTVAAVGVFPDSNVSSATRANNTISRVRDLLLWRHSVNLHLYYPMVASCAVIRMVAVSAFHSSSSMTLNRTKLGLADVFFLAALSPICALAYVLYRLAPILLHDQPLPSHPIISLLTSVVNNFLRF